MFCEKCKNSNKAKKIKVGKEETNTKDEGFQSWKTGQVGIKDGLLFFLEIFCNLFFYSTKLSIMFYYQISFGWFHYSFWKR